MSDSSEDDNPTYGKYTTDKLLGQGGFAQVFRGKDPDGKVFALKVSTVNMLQDQYKEILKSFEQEGVLMYSLDHPNILKIYDTFYDSKTKKLILVLEYAQKGSLRTFLNKQINKSKAVQAEDLKDMFIQLIKGLQYIHEKKVLHRDIKIDNVLVGVDQNKKDIFKYADFGISKVSLFSNLSLKSKSKTTDMYLAPEVKLGHGYTKKADIFSLGMLLYEVIYHIPPLDFGYSDPNDDQKKEQFETFFKNIKYRNEFDKFQLNEILKGFLQKDPTKRMSLENAMQMLEAKEIINFKVDKLEEQKIDAVEQEKVNEQDFFENLLDSISNSKTHIQIKQQNQQVQKMQKKPIACDTGSCSLSIGYAGDYFPTYTFPTIVGRPMLSYNTKIEGIKLKSVMVGDEAAQLKSVLELSYPIKDGIIHNWDDMEIIWDYAFNEKMKIDPEESSIFMTEPLFNTKKQRETTCEILFEKLRVSKVQMDVKPLLALFANGNYSGTVLSSSDSFTQCIPIHDGKILQHQVEQTNIAGRKITDYLILLLQKNGYALENTVDYEIVNKIKEKSCFVSSDIEIDRRLFKETTAHMEKYLLPDETPIKIESERYEAPEIMFNPQKAGLEDKSCHELLIDCINNCPMEYKKNQYVSIYDIVLTGGNTMLPGFRTRLESEVANLQEIRNYTQKHMFNFEQVNKDEFIKYNTFIGVGALIESCANSDSFWIDSMDWLEMGDKCLEKISNRYI